MMKRSISRRRFVGQSLLLSTPLVLPGSVLGLEGSAPASEKIILGGIGINHRGGYDLGFFLDQPDVRFAAIADVAKTRRIKVKAQAEEAQGTNDVAMYRDFRDLLDRKDVDAVLITHTHSDHVRGLGVCMKRIHAPIFMSHTSKNTLMLENATALNYSARTEILPDLWVTAPRTTAPEVSDS